jgi:predicted phosphodiesterase
MGKIYASADWHGNWAASKQALDFLAEDDKLIYLGDCTDRGNYGIKLLKTLMADPRVTYIKGNHDELLEYAIEKDLWDNDLKYIPHLSEYKIQEFDINHWIVVNGGYKTYEALLKETEEEQKRILKYIQDMPLTITLTTKQGKIILEHAGYTPGVTSMQRHDPLWDRTHFSHEWVTSADTYIVHGHTPVQYLKYDIGYNGENPLTEEEMLHRKHFFANKPTDYKPTILRYCHGHKFDLDMCTIYSDRVALLDLDTFEEYYFDGKDE